MCTQQQKQCWQHWKINDFDDDCPFPSVSRTQPTKHTFISHTFEYIFSYYVHRYMYIISIDIIERYWHRRIWEIQIKWK